MYVLTPFILPVGRPLWSPNRQDERQREAANVLASLAGGYLPHEWCAPVHCWLVLLRFGWINHVGDALEELSINYLEIEL